MLIAASERPSQASPRRTVAIVGGGASGMLFAAQLLSVAAAKVAANLRLVLIERRDGLGGAAYSTRDPSHRLNVTAAGMSAFPDDPGHYVRWREQLVGTRDSAAYASRAEYCRYLEDVLATAQGRAAPAVSLARIIAEVVAVEPASDGVKLELADGATIAADLAVLAIGNLPASVPPGYEALAAREQFVCDPWSPGELDRIGSAAKGAVLLIGSGLTTVDLALSLASRRPAVRVIAMSRSGLLPRAHLSGCAEPTPAPTRVDQHVSLAELVDRVLAEAAREGPRWRQLVDGLRPVTQAHWRRLSFEQRATFMATRHRAWSVHRHRMAPEVAWRLAGLFASGQLEVYRGVPNLARSAAGGLVLSLSGGERVALSLAVNCTGPVLDPRACELPLVAQLLADQHVRAHPLGIGFDTAPSGAFRGPDGAPQARLFTLGPPRIGELYETTAVPEIREQALALALDVASRLAIDGTIPANGRLLSPGLKVRFLHDPIEQLARRA